VDARGVLEDLFARVDENVHAVVAGLAAEQLTAAPGAGANPIGWLVWHLTRVQDHHVAELLDREQEWVTGSWPARFGLPADPDAADNTGYGHTPAEVAAVHPDGPHALTGYYDAVRALTAELLGGLDDAALDRIVDRRWDPPVTLGVRLVSVADDMVQHVGQAAYVRGLLGID
jgi:uncharacterized damage-inducible protein DinB